MHWGIENRAHRVRDRIILRAHDITNVSEATCTNALSPDCLLTYDSKA